MTVAGEAIPSTYWALRMLGEHVLSAARHDATGRIGLVVVPDGIATPPFGEEEKVVGVIGGRLVVSDRSGSRDTSVTTLRAAAEFVGIVAGAPRDVYTPTTRCDLDAPLPIDATAFVKISDWYTLVATALATFIERSGGDERVAITLWPEHFDVAVRLNDVNYGGLAGDGRSLAPYAYVGPDAGLLPSPLSGFWTAPFGAMRTRDEVASAADLVGFFEQGEAASAALMAEQTGN